MSFLRSISCRLSSVLLLCIFCLSVCACDKVGLPVKIGRVLAEPAKYQDRTVTVSGTVTEAFSILSVGYYKVQDDSGEIAVLPTGASPVVGSTVSVRGRIRSIYTIGDRAMLVLEQKDKNKDKISKKANRGGNNG